jgi:hypothetical protein
MLKFSLPGSSSLTPSSLQHLVAPLAVLLHLEVSIRKLKLSSSIVVVFQASQTELSSTDFKFKF